MKQLWMILVLFALGPGAASAASIYTVHVQGSTQPYICVACDLSTPIPDPKTRETLNAWKEGKAPFADSATHRGIVRSLSSGDTVALCNGCGCATYVVQEEGLWAEGTFQARRTYPASASSATSKNPSNASKATG
ncbi:hypothetical protein ACFFJT_01355 [Dyella flava]|uniref:Uncharacterized protein n=1 Tax=Dyella flava TaxID=1920170 RepID=A0ABS2K1B1_9GAMM|nr:hypothetical protein [Dyella flava]MBM7125040.1 hypothetical protein [Dyella flava]